MTRGGDGERQSACFSPAALNSGCGFSRQFIAGAAVTVKTDHLICYVGESLDLNAEHW